MGLGATGLSCARHLHRRGLPFAVVDTRAAPPGLAALRSEMPEVPVFAGDIPTDLIESAGELIVSPGIALEDPLVVRAREAEVAIVGDIDLFVREAAAPVVGITGSNAKSTVTELVGQMAVQFEASTPDQLEAAREILRKMQFLQKLRFDAEALEAELDEAI